MTEIERDYQRLYRLAFPEKHRAHARLFDIRHPEQVAAIKKRWAAANIELVRRAKRAWKLRNIVRNRRATKAQDAVKFAKRIGRLVPEPCVVCGRKPVHAHHEDYSRPLVVIWLCPKHHKQLHLQKL